MRDIELDFSTKCIHGGQAPEKLTGAVMPPIFQTSTYVQEAPLKHKGYEYSRTHNPTRKALEDSIMSLESGTHGFCFASGMAAITAIMMTLKKGDHVLASDDLYGGTSRLFNQIFSKFGVTFSYANFTDINNVTKNIQAHTKLIWIETPSNPLLKLVDIKAICALAKKNNILTAVDNTFATPALQNPLLLGADYVVHSSTKYLGGHSDTIGGAIVVNDSNLASQIGFISNSFGGVPAPFDCFLLLRGIKTLDVRMERTMKNAQSIANWLLEHKQVEKVYFPSLATGDQKRIYDGQMRGPSGVISFVLKDSAKDAKQVCASTQIFACAESLGGVESLIEHPSSMTHASVNEETRELLGISNRLIRISVGIESINDLIKDLKNAIM